MEGTEGNNSSLLYRLLNGGEPSATEVVPERPKPRIFVLDDQPQTQEGLKHYVESQSDFRYGGGSDDLGKALESLVQIRPEVLVVGLRRRGADVLEFIKLAKARLAQMRILVLSAHDEALYAERALRAGAQGYLVKHETWEEVGNAIRKILRGEICVSRHMGTALLTKLLRAPAAPAAPNPRPRDGLSDRELQVFNMLGTGLGSREIATQLNLSVKTVETYRENIKHKFGLKTAAELVRQATTWTMRSEATASPVAVQGLRNR